MPRNVLLANAKVIGGDGNLQGPVDILIESGVIKDVVQSVDEREIGARVYDEATEIRDCRNCYVSPGLVNLHTHSPMTILRGIAEDVSVEDWFNSRIWPFESVLTPEDIKIGAMLAIYEMLDCGVTAFFDHYFYSEEIAAAALEAGIRADIAPTIFGMAPGWQEALDKASLLIESMNHNPKSPVRMRLGPHAPYTCPPEVLEACAKRAEELGAGAHIHVSETEKQVLDSVGLYGKTPFARLKEAGLLDVPCIIAHGIWIQEEELGFLGKDSVFAVAPKTYLKLSSGFGNLYKFQWETLKQESILTDQAGQTGADAIGKACCKAAPVALRVGIGTDGAASSNTLNPLEQARLYGLLAKDYLADACAYPLKAIWQMLMEGHSALGQNTGEVAPGYNADLVVWDLSMAHTWPVYDPLAAIIYSADARNVRDVLVGGDFKKKDGKVFVYYGNVHDKNPLLDEVQCIKERLLATGAGTAKVKY